MYLAVDLPLLLAGPILRRVEPTLVSVWVALSSPASLRLRVWEGRKRSGTDDAVLFEHPVAAPVTSLRIGAKLHIAQVTLKVPDNSTQTLQADRVYSYDLEFDFGGDTGKKTLASLHLLEAGSDGGIPRAPLGFEPDFLPSFAPPPSELDNLKILFGSCRRPAHPDPDAMVWIDDLLLKDDAYKDARRRPHQLFLGGDQIYADDVTEMHMLLVTQLGVELVGTEGPDRHAVEQVKLDGVLSRPLSVTPDPEKPLDSYKTESDERELPADRAHFPEGKRLHLTLRAAQFTSSDGDSHLISFGDFAAMYLTVWSPDTWGTQVPGVRVKLDPAHNDDSRELSWNDELTADSEIVLPAVEFPESIPKHLYRDPTELTEREKEAIEKRKKADAKLTAEQLAKRKADAAQKDKAKRQRSLHGHLRVLAEFRRGLPKVRRAMANVPTYMIFDDHDVTDDWNLNPLWRDRVMTTALGVVILRNALASYAVFQDWGNDPAKYEKSANHRDMLQQVAKLFPEGATRGPDATAAARLDELYGFDLRGSLQIDGIGVDATKPPVTWHFGIDGPKHRVIALDNRTRRSFVSRNGPPGNVAIDAQVDQIPEAPLPDGKEVLLVVAPLQVIGPPMLDEVVAPLTYRIFDTIGALGGLRGGEPKLAPGSKTGLRGMLGTNPDAIEAWAFDAITFEALLRRLEPYRKVVLLSGDVHYSASAQMSYWKGSATQPARFAQFTSSGFKNVMPTYIRAIDRALGFAQQLIRARIGIERIGWDKPQDGMVLLPDGVNEAALVPALRARLRETPVMVPTSGWPDENEGDADDPAKKTRLNPAVPPDWRWRVKALVDERKDSDRPKPAQPLAIDVAAIDALLTTSETNPVAGQAAQAYLLLAARHQDAIEKTKNSRQILFRSNFGLVRFEHDGTKLVAVHELISAFLDPTEALPQAALVPATYMLHKAVLGPEDEAPPDTLREVAIAAPPDATTPPAPQPAPAPT